MKTIQEVFEEDANSTFPFKINSHSMSCEWINIVAKTPTNSWVGWYSDGTASSLADGSYCFTIYKEPKPKKKLYPILIKRHGDNAYVVEYHSSTITAINYDGPLPPKIIINSTLPIIEFDDET